MPRARELFLIIRARDEASGTLRRAARSVGGLQDPAVLQQRRARLTTAMATTRQEIEQARLRADSIRDGSRRLQQAQREFNFEQQKIRHQKEINRLTGIQQETTGRIQKMEALRMQAMRAQRAGVEFGGRNAAELQRFISGLTNQIRGFNSILEGNTKSILMNQNAMANEAVTAAQLTAQEAELNRMLGLTEREMAVGTQRLRDQQGQMNLLNRAIAALPAENLERVARSMGNVGRTMQFAGAAALFVMGAFSQQAAEFATNATRAATQVQGLGNSFGNATTVARDAVKIQAEVLKQMQEFPSTAEDMTNTLYNIYSSMDVTFGQGTRLLTIFNQAWLAGGMVGNVEDVSNALITLANNWGIAAGDMEGFRRLAASTMATVRFGRLTLEQYTQTMNQMAPAFHGAHQSIEEMNAALAFTTRVIPGVRVTAAGLARLIEQLQRAAQPLEENFGIKITDASGNLLPLSRVIAILIKQFPELVKSGVSLNNFFKDVSGNQGTIQARRALQALVLNYDDYRQVLKQTSSDQDEFQRSLRAMSQTPEAKWRTFTNQLHAMMIVIGTDLIPVFAELGKIIQRVTKWWMGLDASTRRHISQIVAWGAVATLLIGTLGAISGALILTGLALAKAGPAFKTLTSVLGIFGGRSAAGKLATEQLSLEVGTITARFGLWGGAITAVLLLMPILKGHFGDVANAVDLLHNLLKALNLMMVLFVARAIATRAALIGIETGFIAAAAAASTFELALIAGGAVAVAYGLHKIPIVGDALDAAGKKLGGWVYDAFHSDPGPSKTMDRMRSDIQEAIKYFDMLKTRGVKPKDMRLEFETHFKRFDEHEMNAYFHAARSKWQQGLQGIHDLPLPAEGSAAAIAAQRKTHVFTDEEFIREMRHLQRLKQAIETAPNMQARLEAIYKLQAAETAAAKHMTKQQKDAQSEIAQALEQVATMSDASFIRAYKNAQRLFRAATASNAIADWKRYYNAVENLSKTASNTQMSYAEKVFGQIEQQAQFTDAQAATAFARLQELRRAFELTPTLGAAKALAQAEQEFSEKTPQIMQTALQSMADKTKVISDETAIAMAQNVQRLKDAFDKTPSSASWEAWYQAEHEFTTLANQDQQQLANDLVQGNKAWADANKQAAEEVKQNFDSVLSKVRSMYDEILQANQSAFGDLFTGPTARGLDEQVQRIRDAGQARADALRNQADKIKDAFDKANKKISAEQGNLIDWGLLPNPENMKNKTDAQVEALNKQADRIQRASDRRADALQKRLEEHKLSAGELINDMRGQINAFMGWQRALANIGRRGAPAALVEQLRQMGPEYVNVLRTINNMTPGQFREYVRLWQRGQEAIKKATEKQLKDQLKTWRKHGKDIAKAIALGIKDENIALTNALTDLIIRMFPGLKVPAGLRPQQQPQAGRPGDRLGSGFRRQTLPQTGHVYRYNTEYHYHASDGDMSPQTFFQKMHFRQRNQRRC